MYDSRRFEGITNRNKFSFMSKDMIAAAGFNVETPIIVAIIGNLTGTLPTKKKQTEIIKCVICDCELTSSIAFDIHKNGSKHKKKLQALEIIEQLKRANDNGIQFRQDRRNPQNLRCQICSMTVNSPQQLEVHFSGSKHIKKLIQAGVYTV